MSIQEQRVIVSNACKDMIIERTLPKVASQLLKNHEHPADKRRHVKFCNEQANKILEIGVAEKRNLTTNEQRCFDAVMAIATIGCMELDLLAESARFNSDGRADEQDRRVYAKGEKCALNYREEQHEGLGLGALISGMAIGAKGNAQIHNALSEGTDSAGGYTVPETIFREFIDKLRDKSVLFNAGAPVILLESNRASLAQVINDPVPGWRAENASVSESDMVFGQVQFLPKSLAVLVKVSRELLADSINVNDALMNALAKAIALQLDYAALYGSGTGNQPTGLKSILTTNSRTSNIGANGAKLSAVGKWLPLVSAAQKVAAGNDQPSAAIMNSRTLYDLSGLADSTGQPLRAPDIISQNMALLDTNSVPVNQTQGTATSVCSEIFTGNFAQMILGLRQELRIEILPQTFAGNLQVGFLASLRADWQCARPSSFWSTTGILAE